MGAAARKAVVGFAALLLAACGGSVGPSDSAGGEASSLTGRDIAAASWPARPPATTPPDAVRLARARLLGPGADDPSHVGIWWFGVSSFIMQIGGHVVLLDAWEPVGVQANYVPITRDDLVDLAPEAIFIGHGHFDHAADAGYVAGRTGATIVGSREHCDTARDDAGPLAGSFACLITGTAEMPVPGTSQDVRIWQDLPPVRIVKHIHSALTFEPEDPGTPFVHVPELLPFLLNPNTDVNEIIGFLLSLGAPEGGAWMYHFRIGDFSLLWHDSSGPINTGAHPSSEAVQAALAALPGCVDVQLGAIVGFNQPASGLRDPRRYVQFAAPKIFLPQHHDAWAPGVGGGATAYESQWRQEIATLAHPPLIDYLRDPQDYMQPRFYRVDDPFWRVPAPGSRCAQ